MSAPVVEPSACRWCGIARRGHGRQYADAVGYHAWVWPSQEQILARMKARRLAATVAREGALPVPVGPEPQPSEVESLKARVAELEELRELATVLEIPRPGKLPLQLRLAYGHDDRWAICDREGRRWHREHGWVFEAQGIRDEEQRDTSRFTLAEAVPLARRLAESEASADKLTKTFSPVASLREPEGEHYALVHHDYRVGHDLPKTGGAPC